MNALLGDEATADMYHQHLPDVVDVVHHASAPSYSAACPVAIVREAEDYNARARYNAREERLLARTLARKHHRPWSRQRYHMGDDAATRSTNGRRGANIRWHGTAN